MNAKVRGNRHILIAAVTALLIVMFLPVTGNAETMGTLSAKDLAQPGEGTGWSYDGTTLTLEAGYGFNIDDTLNCDVVNNGTVYGGTVNGCMITGETFNNGTIDNVAFDGTVNNNGTITYGLYRWDIKIVNNSGGIISGVSYVSVGCEILNYGTISSAIVLANVENHGIIEDCEFSDVAELNNCVDGTISKSIVNTDINNCGVLESNTVDSEVVNQSTGNIKSGTFNQKVTNNGIISGGSFEATVNNKEGAVINGGDFNYNRTDAGYSGHVYNYGTIENGNFYCPIINYNILKNGRFHSTVGNFAEIKGGNYYDFVTNEMTISGGSFSQIIFNNGVIDNSNGTVNGIAVYFDTENKSYDYIVYGKTILCEDLILMQNDTLTVPKGSTLTVPQGVTLNVSGGTVNKEGSLIVESGGEVITADRGQINEIQPASGNKNNEDTVKPTVKTQQVHAGDKIDSPQTGDYSDYNLWMVITALSTAVAGFVLIKRKNA